MFGGQDDNAAVQGTDAPQDDTLNGVAALVGGTTPPPSDTPDSTPSDDVSMPAPSDSMPSADSPAPDNSKDNQGDDSGSSDSMPAPSTDEHAGTTNDADSDELLELKQKALQQLTPLVGELDQSPVDKFRTTMMLIQASDNQALLNEAYQAAQAIEDEKLRAQALLDVVNEINYFTQPKEH